MYDGRNLKRLLPTLTVANQNIELIERFYCVFQTLELQADDINPSGRPRARMPSHATRIRRRAASSSTISRRASPFVTVSSLNKRIRSIFTAGTARRSARAVCCSAGRRRCRTRSARRCTSRSRMARSGCLRRLRIRQALSAHCARAARCCSATQPPPGRVVLVNGIEAWIETNGERIPLTMQRYASDVLYPDARANLLSFETEPWPMWRYRVSSEDAELYPQVRL
ncbi:putative glycogen debranching enzyme, archaeal type, TIGR01561 [Candidatus Burkholderia pumila]|uniref:Glycogen debranching enzyme, archaeal type, TIGR01561 n=1 Tax=Candidatus Burkholderia pumila TaxID=1090375 RepID=A0ABR5HM77_9BURK|nr:putative glycogen debranching enzyme, archaeal type, TIGR01561 [Candidatus Burkholderia pumila]